MSKTIKDLPEHSRPREKLREKGPQSLTDEELVAAILGMGHGGDRRSHDCPAGGWSDPSIATSWAWTICWPSRGWDRPRRCNPFGFQVGPTLLAAGHGQDRMYRGRFAVGGPYRRQAAKHFVCISLNCANEVIQTHIVTIGLLDRTAVHPARSMPT